MKRRIVSVLTALVMALSLLPVQALAEDAAVGEPEEPVREFVQGEAQLTVSTAAMAAGSGRGKAQLQCKLCTSYVQVMYILYAFPLAFCSIVWPNSGIRAMRRKFVPLRCARESAGT